MIPSVKQVDLLPAFSLTLFSEKYPNALVGFQI